MLVVLSILLVGLIPIRTVFAASEEVSIPYRQTWSNKSGRSVDNSFEYRLTSKDGAPLPDEASGDCYSFKLKGNTGGSIKLHFPFTKPGYYNYLVKAYIPERKAYYSYEEETYDVMIMVINSDDGLGIGAMTIQDRSLAKYSELKFSTKYTKKPPAQKGKTKPHQTAGGSQATEYGSYGPGVTGPGTGSGKPGVPPKISDPNDPGGVQNGIDYWALLNLLLMLITAGLALVDAILYFRQPMDKYGNEYEDEDIRRHGLPRILAMAAAVISFILFILTEDMTKPMIWVDEYTLWHLILFIATAILTMMSKKETHAEEDRSSA